MAKLLDKLNGNKKHAIPVLNIGVLLAILGLGINISNKMTTQAEERGAIKTRVSEHAGKIEANRAYTDQETSRLEANKLGKEIFMMHTAQAALNQENIQKDIRGIDGKLDRLLEK